MASKRRGFLLLLAGAAVALVRGADEAAVLVSRGADEVIEAGSKTGDEVGSSADELANVGKRRHRQRQISDLVDDETTSKSFTLPANHYTGLKAETGAHRALSYEFTTLFSAIDVILFDEAGFEAYRGGKDPLPILSGCVYDAMSGERTVTLDAFTSYYLIVDNTDAGLASPPTGDVSVEIEESLSVM